MSKLTMHRETIKTLRVRSEVRTGPFVLQSKQAPCNHLGSYDGTGGNSNSDSRGCVLSVGGVGNPAKGSDDATMRGGH